MCDQANVEKQVLSTYQTSLSIIYWCAVKAVLLTELRSLGLIHVIKHINILLVFCWINCFAYSVSISHFCPLLFKKHVSFVHNILLTDNRTKDNIHSLPTYLDEPVQLLIKASI